MKLNIFFGLKKVIKIFIILTILIILVSINIDFQYAKADEINSVGDNNKGTWNSLNVIGIFVMGSIYIGVMSYNTPGIVELWEVNWDKYINTLWPVIEREIANILKDMYYIEPTSYTESDFDLKRIIPRSKWSNSCNLDGYVHKYIYDLNLSLYKYAKLDLGDSWVELYVEEFFIKSDKKFRILHLIIYDLPISYRNISEEQMLGHIPKMFLEEWPYAHVKLYY